MPTYRNDAQIPLTVCVGKHSEIVPVRQEIQTTYLLDDIDGMTRLDDAPFYNVIEARFGISGQLNDANAELAISNPKNVVDIHIDTTAAIG